ncbi:MAG: DUF2914 domain-containing protein [Gammaproteobacteria bacterium]|nr:DUF2914 domain-containing protein [Gammaproteobacteria bacterium]
MRKIISSVLFIMSSVSVQHAIAEEGMTNMQHEDAMMQQQMQATETEAMADETVTAEPMATEEMTTESMTGDAPADLEGFSRGSVVRSIFTSAIADREPTDKVKELTNVNDKIIYYTELRDMTGQKAIHRWEYNGEVMAEVEFNVQGPRWRIWSSKSFVPGWTGEWKVSVLNGANEVISEDILNYVNAEEAVTGN